MTTEALKDALHISDLRVWAHVGVLDHERRDGQWFSLDLSMRLDLDDAARNDDLSRSADYSLAVQAVQSLAEKVDVAGYLTRMKKGKYQVAGSSRQLFVRILRTNIVVRVGGGWEPGHGQGQG